jgi:hypothetical protein
VNTASELRAELAQVFAQLKAGEIKHTEAAELANLAGKMIASAKVQAERGWGGRMTESTVWRVMHPDGSRTVVGHYPLALAYAKGDRSRIDEITLELHPGPLARELKVMRGMASCGGDDESIQQAEIDLHRLQHIESAALLALGMLWMTERHSPNAQAAFQTLRNALGGQDALRRGIEAAIDAGFEADHPPGADWWAGKKEGKP